MNDMTVIAFGHSHLGSLQAAHERLSQDPEWIMKAHFKQLWGLYHPFVRREGNLTIFHEDLERDLVEMARETGADAFIAALIGSEHFIWAIQGQLRPFDIILPKFPDLPRVPDSEIIPFSVMQRVTYDAISGIMSFHGRLQSLTGIRVYQALPPPPISSQALVLAGAPESLRKTMLENGVPNSIIRYKLWLLWISVAQEIADRDRVWLLHAPPATVGENGMLRDSFCKDAVHGNEDYGRLLWSQFETTIKQGA